jgi:hypothetical protein
VHIILEVVPGRGNNSSEQFLMIQAIQAFPFLPSLSHCFDLTHLFTYLAHLCAYAASALLKVNAKKKTYAERETEK